MPLLLSLLGNKWVWIGLAMVGLAGWGQIQTWRLHNAQDRLETLRGEYTERDRQAQAEADKRLQAALERVRRLEQQSAADQAAISTKLQQEIKNVAMQKDRIIGDLHTGALALRVQLATTSPVQGDRNANPQARPAAGQCDAGAGSGLLAESDATFLVSEASRADEVVLQLQAAQTVILKDREICK